MWTNRTIQYGQSLISEPEQNFAYRAVTNCVESKAMTGNSTVHMGTRESHIVPNRSLQQAEEARRKYGDMAARW